MIANIFNPRKHDRGLNNLSVAGTNYLLMFYIHFKFIHLNSNIAAQKNHYEMTFHVYIFVIHVNSVQSYEVKCIPIQIPPLSLNPVSQIHL